MQQQREPLWSVKDVCQYLNMGSWFVYSKVADGSLPSVKVGHVLRFDPAAIRQWVEARTRGPGNPPKPKATTAAAG